MVTVERMDSEVVVGQSSGGEAEGTQSDPVEDREQLREVVRELVREALEQFLRTEVRR